MATATVELPNMDLDLENTEDLNKPGFTPVKNGLYTLKIKEQPKASVSKPSTANPNGAWMLGLIYTVENPETGNDQDIYDNLVFSEKSLYRVRQWLLSLGKEGHMNASQIFDPEFLASLVANELQADVVIKAEEYPKGTGNMVPRNRVAAYISEAVPSRNVPGAATAPGDSSDGLDDIPF